MIQLRLRTVLIGTGAVFALVTGGTIAYAASAGPISSGIIHGCYTTKASNGSHTLVLQDVGTACPAGDTAIKWNQKGPAGPTGPAGAANVDRGLLGWSNGGAANQTCTLAQVAGPDAASITATGSGDPASICTIDGLQPGSIVTVSGFGPIGADSAGLLDIAGGSLQVWTSGTSGQLSFIAVVPSS